MKTSRFPFRDDPQYLSDRRQGHGLPDDFEACTVEHVREEVQRAQRLLTQWNDSWYSSVVMDKLMHYLVRRAAMKGDVLAKCALEGP